MDYPALNQKVPPTFTAYGTAVASGGKFQTRVNSLPGLELIVDDQEIETDNATARGNFEFTIESGLADGTGILVNVWELSRDAMPMHMWQIEAKVSTD